MKLLFSSLFTLGLLGAMFIAIILPTVGNFDFGLSIFFTAILFALFWMVGPWFNDFIYKMVYKAQWIDLAAFSKRSPAAGKIISNLAKKYHFSIPKIAIIPDNNPTAFTYGSGKWNPRLVVSEGILVYLNENEREAVIAHEMGHIANNDFIIMTIASFMVTTMYHIYRASKPRKGKEKGSGIGFIALIFYIIGSYLLLFLSRTREYLADEFSARETQNPDALSSALVKIAFGLLQVPDTEQSNTLAEGTRTLGIFDYKAAKGLGVAYASDQIRGKKDTSGVVGAIQYDLHAIWAWWNEFFSSHPLTGKRIARLETFAGSKLLYNVEKIRKMPVDKGKIRVEFFRDWGMTYLPFVLGIIGIIAGIFVTPNPLLSIPLFLFGVGIGFWAQANYKFPAQRFPSTTLAAAMSDLYASPIRGTPLSMDGKIIGRGIPGYVLSEDIMLQDKTGLVYVNFESIVPIFGNLFFSLTKVKELLGKNVHVQGWFVRGMGQSLILDVLDAGGKPIRSRQRLMALLMSAIWVVAGGISLVFIL